MAGGNVGIMLALFERVAHAALPKWPIRIVFFSQALLMVTVIATTLARLGEPFYWKFSPLLLVATGAQLASMIAIFRWYGTMAGERHARRLKRKDSPPGGNRPLPPEH